ncbi:HAD ATPase, P-type, family IC [Allomyces macrogynus ATCC 38327]|uniref:HAD ATPase, P-type, family IC n=1 Tax=Allomyces macrogynus (strain ATCC 38327) TaxID=578462 RepID=A0A0L0S2M6_ALLM3|nr:HAD ATPase, P-type, family IC [Allomyces macrogynus ATCC 38327]|eukprot:KNE56614.1 HAD ATPase, P-type, family IC [Allomyces macrogynus ATCC 38327]
MDDLADLVWQQAGVAKPHAAHSTHSTPLAQLAAHPRAPTPVDAARAASPRYPPLPPMMAASSPSPAPAVPMAHYTSAPMRPASAASATPAVARPSNDDPFGALVSFGSAAGGRNAQQASTAHMSLADQVKLKQQQQQAQPAYAITPMGASGRSTPAAARPTVQPQAPTPSLGQFDVAFLDSLVGGGSSSTPANGVRIGAGGGGSHGSSAANSARASPAPPLGLHPFAAPLSGGGGTAFAAPAPVATSSVAAADPWDLLLQGGGVSSSSPTTPLPVNAAPTPANDDLLLGDFFSPAPAARATTPLALTTAPLAPTASPPMARRATPNPPVPAAASAAGIPPPPAPARRMSNPPGDGRSARRRPPHRAVALRVATPPDRAQPELLTRNSAKLVDMGGADNVILARLDQNHLHTIEQQAPTLHALEYYATQGLRTLTLAYRQLTKAQADAWLVEFDQASTTLVNRGDALMEVAEAIEKDLVLLGATAIEDKLQDGVPETIATLAKANLKLWVLTGDRQETAINIGFSCRLLTPSMVLLIINEPSPAAIARRIDEHKATMAADPDAEYALVIEGASLAHVLPDETPVASDAVMALGASAAAASAAASGTQATPSLRVATPPARAEPSFDAKLAKLVDMGFPADMAAEGAACDEWEPRAGAALGLQRDDGARAAAATAAIEDVVVPRQGLVAAQQVKGIVQSKVGELKEQGGVLANMVNVVQARLQQPGSAGGDRTTPDEDHWEREARANFYGGQQPLPVSGSPSPSPPAARRTPPRPRYSYLSLVLD